MRTVVLSASLIVFHAFGHVLSLETDLALRKAKYHHG